MCGVDKAHLLENTSAIEGTEELCMNSVAVLGFTFSLHSVSKSEDFAAGKRYCGSFQWKKKKTKQEVRSLGSRIRIGGKAP